MVGVLAILTLAVSFGLLFFVAFPLALAALALGASGRRRVERGDTRRGRRAANAALVIASAGLVLSTVGAFVTFLFLGGYWES